MLSTLERILEEGDKKTRREMGRSLQVYNVEEILKKGRLLYSQPRNLSVSVYYQYLLDGEDLIAVLDPRLDHKIAVNVMGASYDYFYELYMEGKFVSMELYGVQIDKKAKK